MLVHKYNFSLHISLKLMHTSHDFVATKTCPSYEFSSFRTAASLRLKKCRAVWKCAEVCRAGSITVSQIPAGVGWGWFKLCGAGVDKNFNPRRTLLCTCEVKKLKSLLKLLTVAQLQPIMN